MRSFINISYGPLRSGGGFIDLRRFKSGIEVDAVTGEFGMPGTFRNPRRLSTTCALPAWEYQSSKIAVQP